LSYLHPDTYYYIYEDSIENKDNFYVSASEFENLQEQVNSKASNSSYETLAQSLNEFKVQVKDTYLETQIAQNLYATITLLNSTISESLQNYYTITESDNKFVTKESLKGGIEEGDDDFVFVTQSKYNED
jgi:hypothetical protein